jgi:hypothetical protein
MLLRGRMGVSSAQRRDETRESNTSSFLSRDLMSKNYLFCIKLFHTWHDLIGEKNTNQIEFVYLEIFRGLGNCFVRWGRRTLSSFGLRSRFLVLRIYLKHASKSSLSIFLFLFFNCLFLSLSLFLFLFLSLSLSLSLPFFRDLK